VRDAEQSARGGDLFRLLARHPVESRITRHDTWRSPSTLRLIAGDSAVSCTDSERLKALGRFREYEKLFDLRLARLDEALAVISG